MIDAIVIGGGPAGSSFAARVAQAGREVVLLERDTGPADKVCGEFLSDEAGRYLRTLGIDAEALGAVPITTVRLCAGRDVVEAKLPFPALSLSRRVLDEALLGRAAAAGATVQRSARVAELSHHQSGFLVRLESGATLSARTAILATGKHDLRGFARPHGPQDDLLAFKLHLRLTPRQTDELAGRVELILFEDGYAGLQLIEGGLSNLCLVVRRRRFAALHHRWDTLFASLCHESPVLEARLSGALPCWLKPLALSAIPYGHVQRGADDGVRRLGDQAAVIPSFSGDGMSIAMHSAAFAARSYLDGEDASLFQRSLARDLRCRVLLTTALSQALVRRRGQRALITAAGLFPALLSSVARHTRIPDRALARAGADNAG